MRLESRIIGFKVDSLYHLINQLVVISNFISFRAFAAMAKSIASKTDFKKVLLSFLAPDCSICVGLLGPFLQPFWLFISLLN